MQFLKTAFVRFNRLVDWFIPAEMAADRAMRKQAQMFLVSHICGPFIGNSVPLAVYLLASRAGYQNIVLTGSITGFWIFPFLLKYFNSYNALAILSIQNLMFCIIWSCLMLGGIQSPTAPWILTIPLLSFFYLGSAPDIRILILLMFTTNFAGFWLVSDSGIVPPSGIGSEAAQFLGVVSTVAAALYIAMMALFYAKALVSKNELEAEVREHIDTARDLRRAAAVADRATAMKAGFLTRISSEMRFPLHAVIGYSSILIDDAEHQTRSDAVADLRMIRASGLDLLRFVNDVLDLSKIETGAMEIFNDIFDPGKLIRDVAAELAPAAAENGNEIRLELDGSLAPIGSDMRKVRIVLLQLLSNAVKFTNRGFIDIDARIVPFGSKGTLGLVFRVSDTGVGIEPRRMATLFEQFAVNDDLSASRFGGSGLGLALCRQLCRLLGGDVDVETTWGVGTQFTVHIPLGSALPLPEARPATAGTADGPQVPTRKPHADERRVLLPNVA